MERLVDRDRARSELVPAFLHGAIVSCIRECDRPEEQNIIQKGNDYGSLDQERRRQKVQKNRDQTNQSYPFDPKRDEKEHVDLDIWKQGREREEQRKLDGKRQGIALSLTNAKQKGRNRDASH